MGRRTLQQRKNLAAALPWVYPMDRPTHSCQGVKLKDMSESARKVFSLTGQAEDRHRCTLNAAYKLRALPLRRGWEQHEIGRSGLYCFIHLQQEIHDHERERLRAITWWLEHPEVLEENGGVL